MTPPQIRTFERKRRGEHRRLERAVVEAAKTCRKSELAYLAVHGEYSEECGWWDEHYDEWLDRSADALDAYLDAKTAEDVATDALLAFEAAQEAKQAHQDTAP